MHKRRGRPVRSPSSGRQQVWRRTGRLAQGCELGATARDTRPLAAPGKPVCEPHDSTGEPGAGNRPAGFGERGEETCLRVSDCGPARKRRMSHRTLPVTRLPSTLPVLRSRLGHESQRSRSSHTADAPTPPPNAGRCRHGRRGPDGMTRPRAAEVVRHRRIGDPMRRDIVEEAFRKSRRRRCARRSVLISGNRLTRWRRHDHRDRGCPTAVARGCAR